MTSWTVAYQAPPSLGFSRQEYWSGLPLPSPGDLPDPGIEPRSPALQANALQSEPPGKFSVGKINMEDFGEEGVQRNHGLTLKRLSPSHKELMPSGRDLVLFQIWRDAKIGIMKSVLENIYLKILFHQFLWSRVPHSPPWTPSGVLKVRVAAAQGSARGRWQLPLASANR